MSATRPVGGSTNFAKTMAQGMAMLGGKDIANYTLVFEDQPINISEKEKTIWKQSILLGRGSDCVVRYGDNFSTVSRKHAEIHLSKEGVCVLKHLSSTNPTLINDEHVTSERKLNPGDSIQLSTLGPRLRFINTPINKTTASMKLSRRLQEFGSQALLPYKRAIAVLSLLVIGLSVGGGYVLKNMNEELKDSIVNSNEQAVAILNQQSQIGGLKTELEERTDLSEKEKQKLGKKLFNMNQELERLKLEKSNDNIVLSNNNNSISNNISQTDNRSIAEQLEDYEDDIFFIYIKNDQMYHDWQGVQTGTAFLTKSGKLVTARHVLTPWRFNICEILNKVYSGGERIYTSEFENYIQFLDYSNSIEVEGGVPNLNFVALSPKTGREFQFNLKQAVLSTAYDKKDFDCGVDGVGEFLNVPNNAMHTDWAFVQTNMRGEIELNPTYSSGLKKGQKLYGLGYTHGLSFQPLSDAAILEPLFLEGTVAQRNLKNKMITISQLAISHGASGAPMFAKIDGGWNAIGIVSNGRENLVRLVPIDRINM